MTQLNILQPAVVIKIRPSYFNLGLPSHYADSDDEDEDNMTWSAAGSRQMAGSLKTVEDEFSSYAYSGTANIDVDGDILGFWQVLSFVSSFEFCSKG